MYKDYEHRLTKLETSLEFITNQVSNHLPTAIKELKSKQDEGNRITMELKDSIMPFITNTNTIIRNFSKDIDDLKRGVKENKDFRINYRIIIWKVSVLTSCIGVIAGFILKVISDKLHI